MCWGVEGKLEGRHWLVGPQRSSRAKFPHHEGRPDLDAHSPLGAERPADVCTLSPRFHRHHQPIHPRRQQGPHGRTKACSGLLGAPRDCDGKAHPYFSKGKVLPVDMEMSRLLFAEGVRQTPSNHFKTRQGLEDQAYWLFRISPSALAH